jgi:RNA polymerase sigma-70 factor (ECF subfamily)
MHLADEFSAGLLQLVPKLRVHALTLTRNRTAAEDLVQDTIVNALAARHSFAAGTNLNAWTHTILRNRFISTMRKRRELVDLETAPQEAFVTSGSQEDRLALKQLGQAIVKLPPEQREALIMAVVLGMSYDAIAATMNCAEGTAKSKVFRARQQLKAMVLGADEPTCSPRKSATSAEAAMPRSRATVSQSGSDKGHELRQHNVAGVQHPKVSATPASSEANLAHSAELLTLATMLYADPSPTQDWRPR